MAEKVELLEKRVGRPGSLCRPDPYVELYKSYLADDFEKFSQIIDIESKKKFFKIDYLYRNEKDFNFGDLADRTLLYFMCEKKKSDYVKVLIKNGADPNLMNSLYKMAPIHIVSKNGDIDTFKLLLDCSHININLKDSYGCSAIHYAMNHVDLLKELLKCSAVDINTVNRKGETPIHFAIKQKHNCKETVEIMIGRDEIDLDVRRNYKGDTVRKVILDKYSDMKDILPDVKEIPLEDFSAQTMFDLLSNDIEKFIISIKKFNHLINEGDGHQTLLQYACDKGLMECVKLLIELGANPNLTSTCTLLPSMITAKNGYYNILEYFINKEDTQYMNDNETALHCVIDGFTQIRDLPSSPMERDHFQCLKLLLENIPKTKLDINYGNNKQNTALHLAAKQGNREVILLLLHHGAYIGSCNELEEPAFIRIKQEILETSLDECIKENNKLLYDDDYEIIIDYSILNPSKTVKLQNAHISLKGLEEGRNTYKSNNETDVLLKISQISDFRHLLKHPVITSFLHLKWHRIRKFFFFNFGFYLLYWFFLSWYILGIYTVPKNQPTSSNQTNINDSSGDTSNETKTFMQALVAVFLVLLIIRELFQLITYPGNYIKNAENILEVGIIITTFLILYDQSEIMIRQQISAIGILLSWTELVLLIGKHPALSTYIEMLKTVSINFIQFLSWYSILIVAFALSFYTLFHQSQLGNEENDFADIGVSTFKTVIMLTGEFDADSIPFIQHPITSHILFVIFVFLITIILFNLLNGLAVSDTQAIKSDAELFGIVSQVKLISYIETVLNNPFSGKSLMSRFKSFFCCFSQFNYNRTKGCMWSITIFPEMEESKIIILPNLRNKIENTVSSGTKDKKVEYEKVMFDKCFSLPMKSDIVKSAKEILIKKENLINEVSLKNQICSLEKKVNEILRLLGEK